MNNSGLKRLLLRVILLAAAITSLLAQDFKPMLGSWSMTSETNSDPVKWTLSLRDTDGKLAAFLVNEQGEQAAKDVTYADGVLKFKAAYHDDEYSLQLKLNGEKLEGTWTGDDNSGKTTGVRR